MPFYPEQEEMQKKMTIQSQRSVKLVHFDKWNSILRSRFAIWMEDFVKIVKRAGSIKPD